jgi:DNA-binding MarR family transcriptional regulator
MTVDRTQLARTQQCTCSALRRASRAVTAHYEAHFRGSELRGTQFTILSTLAQTGALSMTQLADWLGVERTTLTRNLAVLARRGFVAYTGAKDGRVRKVEITRDGVRTLHACLPRWAAAEASVGAVLRRLKLPRLSA